jgi:hypothetical protein
VNDDRKDTVTIEVILINAPSPDPENSERLPAMKHQHHVGLPVCVLLMEIQYGRNGMNW